MFSKCIRGEALLLWSNNSYLEIEPLVSPFYPSFLIFPLRGKSLKINHFGFCDFPLGEVGGYYPPLFTSISKKFLLILIFYALSFQSLAQKARLIYKLLYLQISPKNICNSIPIYFLIIAKDNLNPVGKLNLARLNGRIGSIFSSLEFFHP